MTEKEAHPGLIIHSIPNTAATHEDESMLDAGTRPGSGIQSPPDTADEHEDATMSDPSPPHVDEAVHGYQNLKPVSQTAPTDTKLGPHSPPMLGVRPEIRQRLARLYRPKKIIDASYLSNDKELWFCCQCNGYSNLSAINEGCSYCCNHWRCSRCVYSED